MDEQPLAAPNQNPQERSFYGKHKLLKWGLFYFAIAIMVYGGIYFFISSKQGLNPYPVAPTSAPQPTPTPTDKTVYTESTRSANWKTYTNTDYNFEVKYPTNWRIAFNKDSPDQDSLQISNNVNTREFLKILINKDPSKPNQGFDFNAPETGKLLSGLPTKEYRLPHPGADVAVPKPGPHVGLWVEKDNKIYAFVFFNTTEVTRIYDQILSTFRFLDQIPTKP